MQQKIADNSMIQELKNEFDQTQVSSDEGTPLGTFGFFLCFLLIFLLGDETPTEDDTPYQESNGHDSHEIKIVTRNMPQSWGAPTQREPPRMENSGFGNNKNLSTPNGRYHYSPDDRRYKDSYSSSNWDDDRRNRRDRHSESKSSWDDHRSHRSASLSKVK